MSDDPHTYDVKPPVDIPPAVEELPPLFGQRPKRPFHIVRDVYCARCGYNLRGLTRRHRCPECGTPAVHSLSDDLLFRSPAAWLSKVRYGLALLLCSALMALLAWTTGLVDAEPAMIADLVSTGVAALGVFLATAPEPRDQVLDRYWLRRWWLRMITPLRAVASAILLISFHVIGSLLASGGTITLGLTLVLEISRVLVPTLGLAQIILICAYFQPFAPRFPDDDLYRSTTHIIFGMTASGSVMILTSVIILFLPIIWIAGLPIPCFQMVSTVYLALCSGWYLLVLWRYYYSFKWSVDDAHHLNDPPIIREIDTF